MMSLTQGRQVEKLRPRCSDRLAWDGNNCAPKLVERIEVFVMQG